MKTQLKQFIKDGGTVDMYWEVSNSLKEDSKDSFLANLGTTLIVIFLLSIVLTGCATNKMHKDVEVGNEAVPMMQCRVLCDDDKVYAYTKNGLKCQCQKPVENTQVSPVLRFEVINKTGQNDSKVSRGVMTQLLNGKTIISSVPGGK